MAHDGLGPDKTICKTEFIEAMRAQVLADNPDHPDAAENLDLPEVQRNFAPLGDAVYRIATQRAMTVSHAGDDAAFWKWVADLGAWIEAVSDWQQGVARAVASWTPTNPAEKAFKNAILALPNPGLPPASTPTRLNGRIE